jgi:hypothetical protein
MSVSYDEFKEGLKVISFVYIYMLKLLKSQNKLDININ